MARVVVLGGGQQGCVIAPELARHHEVTVADVRALSIPDVECVVADLADTKALTRLIGEADLAVGALPAGLGYRAARASIEAGRNYVDVSFYAEDAVTLHDDAKRAGIAVLPDCGFAPGLSNLVVGRALESRRPKSIHIHVGGVARDPSQPYGYAATWSLEDLLDAYQRPARIVRGGAITSVPALSGLERLEIDGVGEMEAFFTDGLRTLLAIEGVGEITEKTLRWPGHADAVQPLIASGTFVRELGDRCRGVEDMVVLRVQIDDEVVLLVDHARDGMSAMARTTALTTATFAHWVATGRLTRTGVVPPELVGRDPDAYRFILDTLRRHQVVLTPTYPFLDD
ncbi:MAG: saccharopine dehydrogenase C-terminal domain-containing protein [Myxococcota bacterium]